MSRLLSRVHLAGPTSRAALTHDLGLNRSTIGDLAAALEELGLVTEVTAAAPGRTGRPSHVVVPRPDNAVVAADVGVDRIAVALVGLGGEVLERLSRPHQRGEHDVEHVAEAVAQMVRTVSAGHPEVHRFGAGVSVPGAIRAEDGQVRLAPNLGWVAEPFGDLLSRRIGMPVIVGNDADLGALAEHLRGVAVGERDLAFLCGSVGIGGGFLLGGTPVTGAHGYAGEIGHLVVDPGGAPCRCGNRGCWETKVGENRLLTLAGRLPGGGPDAVAEVIGAAQAGERRAREALADVADWLGVGLRAVVNLLDPSMIVLGGSLAPVWEAAAERVTAVLDRTELIHAEAPVLIRAARFGEDSPLVGAAELAFRPLLADPAAVAGPLERAAADLRAAGAAS